MNRAILILMIILVTIVIEFSLLIDLLSNQDFFSLVMMLATLIIAFILSGVVMRSKG